MGVLAKSLLAAGLSAGLNVCVASVGYAQGASHDDINAANNPLTPSITLNLQDYYVPSFKGLPDRQANQFLLRGLIPAKLFDVPQLIRFTLPVANSPTFPYGSDTGLGDLTLIDLSLIPMKGFAIGLGPLLVAPTASTKALGAGKWQAGGAAVVIAPQSWGLLGGLVTYQQSFAGDGQRDDVKILTFQPVINYNLPEGFYLRSSAIWNFNFQSHAHYIPVGLGIGKVWKVGKTTINAFIEPQYTAWRHGDGVPRWQIFGGINFQFALADHVK